MIMLTACSDINTNNKYNFKQVKYKLSNIVIAINVIAKKYFLKNVVYHYICKSDR